LRRSKPQSSSDIVEFTDLKIDRITKRVYRKDKDRKNCLRRFCSKFYCWFITTWK
jgi:hypothetical protein